MLYTTKKRIAEYEDIKDYIDDNLNENDTLRDLFAIKKVLGKGVQGSVFLIKPKTNDTTLKFLAMKVSVMERGWSSRTNPFTKEALIKGYNSELVCNILVNELILQNICPHFALSYGYEFSNFCNISKKSNKKCIIQLSEYINGGTLSEWMKTKRSNKLIYNAFFQICTALAAMKKYFNLSHTDLHADNVMYKKTTPGGYWKYIINGQTYNVPNLGYVFMIMDLGYGYIPKKMQTKWFHKGDYAKHNDNIQKMLTEDIDHIMYIFEDNEEILDDLEYVNILRKSKKNHIRSIDQVLLYIFGGTETQKVCRSKPYKCYDTKIKGKPIEVYDLDSDLDTKMLPKELRRLVKL